MMEKKKKTTEIENAAQAEQTEKKIELLNAIFLLKGSNNSIQIPVRQTEVNTLFENINSTLPLRISFADRLVHINPGQVSGIIIEPVKLQQE